MSYELKSKNFRHELTLKARSKNKYFLTAKFVLQGESATKSAKKRFLGLEMRRSVRK
jgi:hypothetical protein